MTTALGIHDKDATAATKPAYELFMAVMTVFSSRGESEAGTTEGATLFTVTVDSAVSVRPSLSESRAGSARRARGPGDGTNEYRTMV